jgi:hypothetical protein
LTRSRLDALLIPPPLVLRDLADEALRGNIDMAELSRFIATVIPTYLHDTITGKIIATPNPVSFGQGNVVISWETNDPVGAEVRVSTSPGDEKLVSQSKGQSGQMEIPWIVDSTIYDFRLYAASQPETPIDSVQVRRALDSAPMVLREIADEALRGNTDMAELSRFVATVIPVCLRSTNFREFLPVVLRELAIMRKTIDIMELSQFIAAVMVRLPTQRKISRDLSVVGAQWFSCYARAFLSTNSRHSELARNAVESAE